MDVLSEVLRVVRLSGIVHFRGEFSRPWAIRSSPPGALRGRMPIDFACVTPFHLVTMGSCWIRCGEPPPFSVAAGDVIVFPRGDQHVMASDLDVPPTPIHLIHPTPLPDRLAVVAHGGGGEPARFICGFLHSDQRFNPLLDALPPAIRVRLADDALTVDFLTDRGMAAGPRVVGHAAQWWAMTLRYMGAEATASEPGGRAMLARLGELMFLEVLRWCMQRQAEGRRGWLAGLNDAHVGCALRLLHGDPARPWTVEELARAAALSRAAFAKRFSDLVGEAPMQYLASWRMHLARHLLRESSLGLAAIAERVGYQSEAGFNRAFKRQVGLPPDAWRRNGDDLARSGGASAPSYGEHAL